MTKYEHPSYFSFALISVGICCGSGAKGSMGTLRLAQSSRQTQPSQPRIEKKSHCVMVVIMNAHYDTWIKMQILVQ